MLDLCVMRYIKETTLDNIQVQELTPDYIVFRYDDARYTLSISLDGTSVTFAVLSNDRVRVTVPRGMDPVSVTDVRAVVDVHHPDNEYDLDLALTEDGRSGLTRLVQSVVKLLCTTRGSDKFDVESGGGLLETLRRLSIKDSAVVAGVVAMSVKNVKKQIMEYQAGTRIADEETLEDVRVIDVETDLSQLLVMPRLLVSSRSGSVLVSFASEASA